MDYNTWLDAVNQCLLVQGKTLNTSQIDPLEMTAAFNSGISPVIFARSIHSGMLLPSPQSAYNVRPSYRIDWTVPQANTKVCRVTHLILTFMAWIFWGTGILCIAAFILILFGTSLTSLFSPSKESQSSGFGASVIVAMLFGPLAIVNAFAFFVSGSIWHWLAQMLVLSYHQKNQQST